MSNGPPAHARKDGDSDEYDDGILFEEYVERAEDNFQDPELETIQALLEKMGFKIKAEQVRNQLLKNKLTGVRTIKIIANFALVDAISDEPIIVLRQRVLFAPVLGSKPARQDHEFLKSAGIRW